MAVWDNVKDWIIKSLAIYFVCSSLTFNLSGTEVEVDWNLYDKMFML